MPGTEIGPTTNPDIIAQNLETQFGYEPGSLDVQIFINAFDKKNRQSLVPASSSYEEFNAVFARFANLPRRATPVDIYAQFKAFAYDPLSLSTPWLRRRLAEEYDVLVRSLKADGLNDASLEAERISGYLDEIRVDVDLRLLRSLQLLYVLTNNFFASETTIPLMSIVTQVWDRETHALTLNVPLGFHRLVNDIYQAIAADPLSKLSAVDERRVKAFEVLLNRGDVELVRKMLPVFETNSWRSNNIADKTLEAAAQTPVDDERSQKLVSQMVEMAREEAHMIESSRLFIPRTSNLQNLLRIQDRSVRVDPFKQLAWEFGGVFAEWNRTRQAYEEESGSGEGAPGSTPPASTPPPATPVPGAPAPAAPDSGVTSAGISGSGEVQQAGRADIGRETEQSETGSQMPADRTSENYRNRQRGRHEGPGGRQGSVPQTPSTQRRVTEPHRPDNASAQESTVTGLMINTGETSGGLFVGAVAPHAPHQNVQSGINVYRARQANARPSAQNAARIRPAMARPVRPAQIVVP